MTKNIWISEDLRASPNHEPPKTARPPCPPRNGSTASPHSTRRTTRLFSTEVWLLLLRFSAVGPVIQLRASGSWSGRVAWRGAEKGTVLVGRPGVLGVGGNGHPLGVTRRRLGIWRSFFVFFTFLLFSVLIITSFLLEGVVALDLLVT